MRALSIVDGEGEKSSGTASWRLWLRLQLRVRVHRNDGRVWSGTNLRSHKLRGDNALYPLRFTIYLAHKKYRSKRRDVVEYYEFKTGAAQESIRIISIFSPHCYRQTAPKRRTVVCYYLCLLGDCRGAGREDHDPTAWVHLTFAVRRPRYCFTMNSTGLIAVCCCVPCVASCVRMRESIANCQSFQFADKNLLWPYMVL